MKTSLLRRERAPSIPFEMPMAGWGGKKTSVQCFLFCWGGWGGHGALRSRWGVRRLIGCSWLWRVWGCATWGWWTAQISYCSRQRGTRTDGRPCGCARGCGGWSPARSACRSLQRCTGTQMTHTHNQGSCRSLEVTFNTFKTSLSPQKNK